MKSFWMSWYGSGGSFELHWPWWISGYRGNDDAPTICAAVRAADEDAAKQAVLAAHDDPTDLEWRFVNERPNDWTPYCDRFPKAGWMQRESAQ